VAIAYFAYGSNMSARTMAERAPRASLLGRARLDGFRLEFLRRSIRWQAGVADIVEADGEEVWGVLWEIADSDGALLDEKEGAGWAYRRRKVEVSLEDGRQVGAVAYEVISKEPAEVPPRPDYVALLVEAAREAGLPPSWVAALEARG
jgi:cation transport regulator ChaC